MNAGLLTRLLEARLRNEPAAALLFAQSKREVEKLLLEMTLTQDQLFSLIEDAEYLGFNYSKKTYIHMPPAPPAHSDERSPSAILKQIHYLEQRKNVLVHIFSNSKVWSVFYFTYRDVLNEGEHFVGGSHIHFTSNLWGQKRTLGDVLSELKEEKFSVAGTHIKFDFSNGDR